MSELDNMIKIDPPLHQYNMQCVTIDGVLDKLGSDFLLFVIDNKQDRCA